MNTNTKIETDVRITDESQYASTLTALELEYKTKRQQLSNEIKELKAKIEIKKKEARALGISPKEKRRYANFVGHGEMFWLNRNMEDLKRNYIWASEILADRFPNVVVESTLPTKKDIDVVLSHSKTVNEYYPGGFPSSSNKVPDPDKLTKLAGHARNLNQALVLIKAFCAVHGQCNYGASSLYNQDNPLIVKAKSFGANKATLDKAISFPRDPSIETTYKFKW